jgi:hypothetical protein
MYLKNEYIIDGDITTIIIKNKNNEIFNVLIDTEDLEKLQEIDNAWIAGKDNKSPEKYYIKSSIYNYKKKNLKSTIYLHKIITNAEDDDYVDHINHNTLDNRKCNLRITKQLYNTKNRKGKNINNKSGYRNVFWNTQESKWCVALMVERKHKVLGKFDDVHEAGKFAEKMREKYYKEFKGIS